MTELFFFTVDNWTEAQERLRGATYFDDSNFPQISPAKLPDAEVSDSFFYNLIEFLQTIRYACEPDQQHDLQVLFFDTFGRDYKSRPPYDFDVPLENFNDSILKGYDSDWHNLICVLSPTSVARLEESRTRFKFSDLNHAVFKAREHRWVRKQLEMLSVTDDLKSDEFIANFWLETIAQASVAGKGVLVLQGL